MLKINGVESTVSAGLSSVASESSAVKLSLFSDTRSAPNLAAAIDVTPAATAWKLGNVAAIVATGGITTAFQITGVNVEGMGTTSGDCQLVLYEGTAGTSAVASVRFTGSTAIGKAAAGINSLHIPVVTRQIAANKSVKAKVAAATTTQPVPAISINYKVG